MSKKLVLAEKPSVARDIGRVLNCHKKGNGFIEGEDYIVTWALGHLVTLADPEMYNEKYKNWVLEDLPIVPNSFKFVVIKQTNKQFQAVKTQMLRNDVSEIIIATDAGREGELVARLILEKVNPKKPLKRLWISSVTDAAIKDGFKKLKDGRLYDGLYAAAKARSVADWLVGINATRALTTKYNAELSCGRVQTPTLAMLKKREEDIARFKPQTLYHIEAKTSGMVWKWKDEKTGSDRTLNESVADGIKKELTGQKGVVTEVNTKIKKEYPPKLYDLTALQKDANQLFGYSAKETLNTAQSLYERHKILTYPRTDSNHLTTDMIQTLKDRIKAVNIAPYRAIANPMLTKPIDTKQAINDKLVSDHHAIIPTEETVLLSELTDKERKIYDLVVKRFLAILSKPHQYEQTTATLKIGNESFTTQTKITLDLGFKAIYETTYPTNTTTFSSIKEKKQLDILTISVKKSLTTPPPYFTEGTLLGAMENPVSFMAETNKDVASRLKETGGIGTVATRADIIDKLLGKFLMEKKGQELHLTSKGRQLLELVPADLKSVDLTGVWEQKLRDIEKNKLKSSDFITDIISYAKANVTTIKRSETKYKHDNLTTSKCSVCGDFMLSVNGKRGKMLVCQNLDCKTKKVISQTTNARCPNCRKKLELRGEGDKKMFSCVCGHRERLTNFEKRKKEQHKQGSKKDVQKYLRDQSKNEEPLNNPFADALSGLKLKD